ncbi:MAG: 3-hydroxyacyl-[acyl-carrier-protein] dehydratase FabA, partial [Sandaracinaceae bacterium]|nr:3-hydroxyacyl-[acyl-carrier-protein] dehydratase FabA [Sandaracinaceae bacterium]
RYAIFDGLRRAPRLPGPPYHFVSRVEEVAGEPWTKKPGARVVMAYDVPPDAWYFDASASGTMPFAVLLEVALQPCGWLASYAGAVLDKKEDLLFRNLDGEGEVLAEVGRDAGTLRTEATLASLSESGGMTIVSFDVIVRAGREASAHDVYRLRTVFGFFPHRAFDNQAGLPGGDPQLGAAEREGEPTSRGRLRLLDRITCDVDRGTARGERAIDPGEWFFAAHFFQDPVQPGSLGMEAMLEVLRALVLAKYPGASSSAFAHRKHRWKYRGQVRPTDGRIAVTVRIVSDERKSDCVAIDAEASFWVGGKRIYEATLGLDAPLAEPAPRDLPLPVAAGGRGEGSAKPEPAPSEPSELEPVLAWWRARLG